MYLRARDGQRGRAPEGRVTIKGTIVSLICAAFLALCGTAPAQTDAGGKDSGPLFPVVQNGKWGYINSSGQIVIEPQFAGAEDKTTIMVFGVRDAGATWLTVSPEFPQVEPFSEGLAAVCDAQSGKWGYMDRAGTMVIKPQFGKAHGFSEGLAAVLVDGKYGYIDKAGSMVVKPQFDYGLAFSEGLARVTVGRKYGFIDKTGSMVIKPEFAWALSFSEGLAAVDRIAWRRGNVLKGRPGYYEGKFGYIDKTGKLVIERQFALAGHFSEGLAAVLVPGKWKWGYIDKTGKYVWEPRD